MAADIEIVYKPGIKYTNISGSDLKVYEGPSPIYKEMNAIFKKNDSMTITRVKGDYAYIPSIGGWVCIQKNGNHYAKMYDPNWKGQIDQYLTDYTSPINNVVGDKEVEMTESTLVQPSVTMAEAEKALAESKKKADQEKDRKDEVTGEKTDEIPYLLIIACGIFVLVLLLFTFINGFKVNKFKSFIGLFGLAIFQIIPIFWNNTII